MTQHKQRHLGLLRDKIFLLVCVLLILNTVICISALRNNNKQMVVLRNAVYVADKNNGDVSGALNKLRAFVHAHMNTGLSSGSNAIKPPIQLKYTYERLASIEELRVQAANARVYTEAQNYCQTQNPVDFSGRSRVPCVTDYVTNHGVAAVSIPPGLYQFDFVSPTWSPDLAGWSVALEIVLVFVLIYKVIITFMVASQLRRL